MIGEKKHLVNKTDHLGNLPGWSVLDLVFFLWIGADGQLVDNREVFAEVAADGGAGDGKAEDDAVKEDAHWRCDDVSGDFHQTG